MEKISYFLVCRNSFGEDCRYGNSRGSVVASRNDQLFVAAGVKKRAFSWFNKMGICNSYKTALKKNSDMGENFNEKALLWKNQHEQEYLQNNNQVMIPARFQVRIGK